MYLLSFAAFPHLNKKKEIILRKPICTDSFRSNFICLEIHHYNLPVNDNDCPTGILTTFELANAGFGNNAFFFLRFCFPPFAPLA